MINFEEILLKEFIKGASKWVSEENCRNKSIEITRRGIRIYVIIKYYKYIFEVIVFTAGVIKIGSGKNSSVRTGLNNIKDYIQNNFAEFIERYSA